MISPLTKVNFNKASILKNKAKLISSTNPENIYITPDLTPLEQRKNRVLRQQLVDLNKNKRVYMIKKRKDSAEDQVVPLRTDNELPPPSHTTFHL